MTEIRFYHLLKTHADKALPQIVQKAWEAGHKVIVRAPDTAEIERLNALLWTYRTDVFLPHGSNGDDCPELQPVWLTAGNDNPNGAKTLVLAPGCTSEDVAAFDLCCEMLDGRDDSQVAAARERWKAYKEKGFEVSYWQQTDKGWEKKA